MYRPLARLLIYLNQEYVSKIFFFLVISRKLPASNNNNLGNHVMNTLGGEMVFIHQWKG